MVPRVLVVGPGPLEGRPEQVEVETFWAPDGEAALARLRRESFDALVVDLSSPPLDGWCVLAAVGAWSPRPRIHAIAANREEATRAAVLGADSCATAGTPGGARALVRSTKETPCLQPHATSSRRLTTTGAHA